MNRLAASVVLLAFAATASAQSPAGVEFQVNTYTTNTQEEPRVAMEPDGDFVVVWMSYPQDGSHFGIFGRRFAASGAPRGGEFQVNTYTAGIQGVPAVAVGRRGDFVVVWNGVRDGSAQSIQGQRFDSAGNAVGGEFMVNTFTPGSQSRARVGRAADGRFVVVWMSHDVDGSRVGIAARRFDASGNPIGGEFVVNTYTIGDQRYADVAVEANGSFVVVWEDFIGGRDGSLSAIFGQRFDAAGNRLGGEFLVNSYTTGSQRLPSVALSPSGGFVVAWSSTDGDGSGYGVFARRFDAAGNAVGSDFVVNTYTTGTQIGIFGQVAQDARGNFVVTWRSPDGSGDGGMAQRFDGAGGRRGAEFQVNTYTTGNQTYPSIAGDAVGNFVVVWSSGDQDGSDYGIFARRFGGLVPAALRADIPGNLVLEPGETREIRPTWQNWTGGDWTLTSTLSDPGGPPGGVPLILDPAISYGVIPNGASRECAGCPVVQIPAASPRPAVHWDGTVVETVIPDVQGQQKIWQLHVGDSFSDVPRTNSFYRFIETLLHHNVTSGCTATAYCPRLSATREQMAVFVLVAKEGAGYVPPACGATPMFADVPASNPFCRWIEELARRAVVSGCGGGNYCPTAAVTREQMAVFVLRTLDPSLQPPACTTPIYGDVPASSGFCRWIEELTRRNVVTGCGGGLYCPTLVVTREQMAVFISATFGLTLYGP